MNHRALRPHDTRPESPPEGLPAHRIDPAARMGAVALTVSDLARARGFYERVLGLRTVDADASRVRLGAQPPEVLVELVGDPAAPPRPRPSTGLFHLALLLPSRAELACALRRVIEAGWPLSGASDHLVSEALYLSDPEGNGIELYRDRPRERWYDAAGTIRMTTEPLDLRELLGELRASDRPDGALPFATRMGHVHLQVADLDAAESFYHGLLGWDVTVRDYPGALFVSAGGYHHHVGLNTWAGRGAPTPAPGSRGLRHVEVVLPHEPALAALAQRVRAAGLTAHADEGVVALVDPSGNTLVLRT